MTPAFFNGRAQGFLGGLVGLQVLAVDAEGVEGRLQVRKDLLAPNGFLHAASVVALADSCCGFGCVANLPQGASGFTTIELKANFLGTASQGAIRCRATAAHLGRTGTPSSRSKAPKPRSRCFAAPSWCCGRERPICQHPAECD